MAAARHPGSLVLLHGFTGGPSAFDALLPHLPSGQRILAPWLLGHGEWVRQPSGPDADDGDNNTDDGDNTDDGVEPSAVPVGARFEAEVARIAALIEPLPEPRHLLGYSLGARVGLGLLVRFPGLLASATLVGVNPGLQTESERQERRQADRSWIELLETDGVDGWISQWEALPLFQTQQRLRAEQLEAQRQLRRAHTAQGLQASLRELGLAQMPNYWSELASIPTPVTLVVGQEDEKFTQLAQATVGHLTSGRVVVIPDAGHNPILEAPAAVGRLLAETLQLSGSQPHPEEASP